MIENCYYLAVHDIPFYTGVVSRPDEWATVDNTSAFYCVNGGCILEDPVEIGGEMVDDLKEALNRWVAMQQSSSDYENWCDDVWMEQCGAPLLCTVYEATEEFTEFSETPQLYPNPAREKVTIEGIETAKAQVYNALGQLVKTVRGTNEIDVEGLAEGVYLVRIMDADGKVYTNKITKR